MTATGIIETVAEFAPELRAGLPGRRRAADAENPSGELQMAADVWADEELESRLTSLDSVGEYASEERDTVLDAGSGYGVVVDPLDGSSNLTSNNLMGTIVGVYDASLPARGRDLIAAAYVLYGPITTMVVAHEGSVSERVIDSSGSARVVDGDVTLPAEPTVYGFGGRVPDWPADFTAYARAIEEELKLRYGGAMIGDVNQVLTYGGVFSYPGLTSEPEGKLRLQFEGNPIAYIIETAGGRSSNGHQSLLDVAPDRLHERTPVHVGNPDLIARLENRLAETA